MVATEKVSWMTKGILSVSNLVGKKGHRFLIAYEIRIQHKPMDECQSSLRREIMFQKKTINVFFFSLTRHKNRKVNSGWVTKGEVLW